MPKDFWDKADIVGKLLSGAVLAIIAFFIKTGSDKIAAAQRQGDLVRNLLADLTSNDKHTRQDLALIALNHSVEKALMVEIAARLVEDTAGYAAGDQGLTSVAFRILLQRDPVLAESLKARRNRQAEGQVSADTALRAVLRSSPDTAAAHPVTTKADSAARAVHDLIAPLSSSIVFIQYHEPVQPAAVEQLRARFAKAGFAAPGVERIATAFASSVRYFHAQDSVLADSVAKITRAFVEGQLPGVSPVPVQNLSGRRFSVPRGQIEVWLSRH